MDVITLEAQPRETGKAAAKAIRRAEEVPCVLYGPTTEPVHFRVPVLALRPLIYTAAAHRVSLQLEGQSHDCILKSITFHPVTDVPAHVDFYALTAGQTITMAIPVTLVGSAPGVEAGGVLNQTLSEVEVQCLPKDIPSSVEVDISGLGVGDSLHVSDLSVENGEIMTDPSRTVVVINAPMSAAADEPEALAGEDETLDQGEAAEDGAADEGAEESEA